MNPLAIALQGIMYAAISIATQGFIVPAADVTNPDWVVRMRRLARR